MGGPAGCGALRTVGVAVCLILGLSTAAPAQRAFDLPTASGRYAAVTLCLAGAPVSLIDVTVLGSDSVLEILAHEERHRQQYNRRGCTSPDSVGSLEALMADEIDAFCASLPFAIRRGIPRGERVGDYLRRIYRQLAGSVSIKEVADRFAEACPEPALQP